MKRALARYWFFINLYHGSRIIFMKNILHRSLDFLPVRPGIPTLRLELLGQTCRKTFSIFCLLMLWSKTINLFCFLKYYKAHVMTLKNSFVLKKPIITLKQGSLLDLHLNSQASPTPPSELPLESSLLEICQLWPSSEIWRKRIKNERKPLIFRQTNGSAYIEQWLAFFFCWQKPYSV